MSSESIINEMLDREWTSTYTCHHHACEAWQKITGEDLQQRLFDYLNHGETANFKLLSEPISPCIVFFKISNQTSTHVGVFFEGAVLHLGLRNGQYVALEQLSQHFSQVRFYQ